MTLRRSTAAALLDGRRALGFLTPLGGAWAPSRGALAWFPVVGAGIGAVLGLAWWAMDKAWPAVVVAAVVVALDLALTGLLHVDGFVDAADGLLPHLDRARRLEVMREPTIGAFGLAAGAALVLLRWAALAALAPSVVLLVGIWAASRATMAVVAVTVPYARHDGGLATAFGAGSGAGRAADRTPGLVAGAIGLLVAAGCAVAWHPLAGLVGLASGLVAAGAVVWLAGRRLGGYTGDVLGAAGVTLETVALVVASARFPT